MIKNLDDTYILIELFPNTPIPLLKELIQSQKPIFMLIFNKYLTLIKNDITYEYSDVVADFFESLSYLTDDPAIWKPMIRILLKIGYIKNRWHVGHVLGRICSRMGVKHTASILTMNSILEGNDDIAEWWKKYLSNQNIPPLIRTTLLSKSEAR